MNLGYSLRDTFHYSGKGVVAGEEAHRSHCIRRQWATSSKSQAFVCAEKYGRLPSVGRKPAQFSLRPPKCPYMRVEGYPIIPLYTQGKLRLSLAQAQRTNHSEVRPECPPYSRLQPFPTELNSSDQLTATIYVN